MHPHIDVFTAQAISGLKYALRLASRTSQKNIRGDDVFFGTINLLRQHDLLETFQTMMGLPHIELCSGEMEKKYHLEGETISLMEEKKLPLSKKLSSVIHDLIEKKHIKKLDLGILFYISFRDLSSPCMHHLRSLGIDKKTLVKTCEKLIFTPGIQQI